MAAHAVTWNQGVQNAWDNVVTFVPKLVAFLVILIIGWIIAKLVAKIVDAILERVGFDRAVERGGVARAMSHSRYDASDLVAKIVYWALLLLTLQLAFGVFGPNPISNLLTGIIAFLPKALVAIILVVIAAAIANAVRDLIVNALSGLSYGRFLGNAAAVFIIALGIIAALNQVGIATTVTVPILVAVLAAIAGVVIVGVGGGLVRPMEEQWRMWLSRAREESQRVRTHVQSNQATSGTSANPGGMPGTPAMPQSASTPPPSTI